MVQLGLERVLRFECTEKPTSVLYAHLLRVSSPELSKLRQHWVWDIPELDSEDWEDMWDFPFKILVSLRDRLIQYKIVHRAYLTPSRLYKMMPSLSSCWRCDHALGNYIHIFWSCPVINVYWSQILAEVNELLNVSIAPSSRICLLGWVEKLVPRVAERTLLG